MSAKIPDYPETAEITIGMRPVLHPEFKRLASEVSEFTFASIYLFRKTHSYSVSALGEGNYLITGRDGDTPFFMLPFGLPETEVLRGLFKQYVSMKCVTGTQATELEKAGYKVSEDRDNFDYLYAGSDLSSLAGRRFHRKKNLVNFFTGHYNYEGKPLLDEYIPDALAVLEGWRRERDSEGDYEAAREALAMCTPLQLCGGIYYVDGKAAAYTLGEELGPKTFAIHFEKGLDRYKGLMQFVNLSFSSILTGLYDTVNREQDLGDEGLRKAKLSYRPTGFVKKYRASLA